MRNPQNSSFKFICILGMSAVCALSIFIACQSKEKKAARDKANFNGSMRNLQQSLEDLLPMVVDSSQYNDPANRQKIKNQVHELVELSTKVQHNPSVAERDPSVTFLSQAFAEDLKKAEESLNMGKREYARYSLMNVTSYCIECHTRTSTGPSFQTQEFKQTLASLSPLERGEFLLATRQFDGALKELNTFIDQRLKEQKNFYELDKAVRDCLAITVRYMRDPKKSMVIAEKIKNAPTAPYYLRQSAAAWEKAIHEWMKEKKHRKSTPASLISEAEKLNQQGMQNQIGMMDRGGDIYFLRALSELHLAMATPLKGDELGKALYLTGVAYEGVPDQTGSNMHENYYESCVEKDPHSEWSKKCFRRLEESIYAGYTGSSGVSLPADVRAHLDELQKKAL